MRRFSVAFVLLVVFASCAFADLTELHNLNRHMRVNVDEIEGIKWIKDIETNQYNMCYVYLGQRQGHTWGRFRIGFTRDSWVFFEKITFNIDGRKLELPFSFDEVTRDNAMGDIWEYVDLPLKDYGKLVVAIMNSRRALVRFYGESRNAEFEIGSDEKDAMRRVLRFYDLIK